MTKWARGGWGLAMAGLWFWIAADGRWHWDEAAYLYTAWQFDAVDIVRGEFQPSGIDGFTTNRLGHLMLAKMVQLTVGAGPPGIEATRYLYLALLLGSLCCGLVVVRWIGVNAWSGTAAALTASTPVFVWLSFKAMPEAPALFAANVTVLALLGSLKHRAWPWVVLGALALLSVALLKATLVLTFASFVVGGLVCGIDRCSRWRMLLNSTVMSLGGAGLLLACLGVMGIPWEQYLGNLGYVRTARDPLVVRLGVAGLELGALYGLLPMALFARNLGGRPGRLFLTWFLVATAPVILVLGHVEARYLVGNLTPLTGLVAVCLGELERRGALIRRATRHVAVVAACGVLVGVGALAQLVMAHEVDEPAMERVVRRLDEQYGRGGYRIVVPWFYTDYHFLQLAYPRLEVYTVFSGQGGMQSNDWLERYYGSGAVTSMAELRSLPEPIVYLGFLESMPVENLRALLQRLRSDVVAEWVEGKIGGLADASHFEASWMYGHPQVGFGPLEQEGPYVWTQVELPPE